MILTPTDPGCVDRYIFDGVNSDGTLPEPGLPFGTYTVCADDRNKVTGTANRRFAKMDLVVSNDPAGLGFETNGDPKVKLWVNPSNPTRGYCT